ncbi:hypothetical protein RchiOBHm_Chr6g0305601 [Rosa chinensis]|uniref:Uncharacterized protein n=1 Tax=Rosa chinensis TaxID=74649 RepID=A0A2P6PZV8_ROSCH|nr:hypothetical protein RchiOBHm_Chr6g0305601 [Rosa chinensis]
MGIKEWYGSRSPTPSIRLGEPSTTYTKAQPKWQIFLKKLKKEKKKSFSSGTVLAHSQQTSYDPKTYSKNFDRGMGWTEPDNLSRSFSARFANPSRVLYRNDLLD